MNREYDRVLRAIMSMSYETGPLKKELVSANEKLTACKSVNQVLRDRETYLQTRLAAEERGHERIMREFSEACDERDHAIAAAESLKAALHIINKQLDNTVKVKTLQLALQYDRARELERKLAKEAQDRIAAQQQLKAAKENTANLETGFAAAMNSVGRLETQLQEVSNERDAAKEKVTRLEKQSERGIEALNHWQVRCIDLGINGSGRRWFHMVTHSTDAWVALKEERDIAKEKAADLEQQLKAADLTIGDQHEEIARLEKEIKETKSRADHTGCRIYAEAVTADLEKATRTQEAILETAESRITALQKQLSNVYENLVTEDQATKKKVTDLEQRLTKAGIDLVAAQKKASLLDELPKGVEGIFATALTQRRAEITIYTSPENLKFMYDILKPRGCPDV